MKRLLIGMALGAAAGFVIGELPVVREKLSGGAKKSLQNVG